MAIHNPLSDDIPLHISITKMHKWRLDQAAKRKGKHPPSLPPQSATEYEKTAEKKRKPITIMNENGEIKRYKSRTALCVDLGYKNSNSSPITSAIRRNGVTRGDGTIEITLMRKKYIILEM